MSSSPHRSALLAAQERLAVLERERVVHPCKVCASKRRGKTMRSIVGILGIVAAVAITSLLFLGPWLLVFASFDMGDIGR